MARPPLPDPDSLRCFVEAARLLNFRAAAAAVGLTPAALGQRIKKLEDLMEVSLFQRSTRRVVLTEAGLALLPWAQRALETAEECVHAARGQRGPAPQDLVLGTRHELGLSWVLPMLPQLRERFPGVTFHVYFGSGPDLENRVHTQQIDCAVSSRRITDPKLESVNLHREDYVFVGRPDVLAAHPIETPEDARHHTLIDAHMELPLFRYWRDAEGGTDSLSFDSLVRIGTIAGIRLLLLQGEGVAVLPRYLVQEDLDTERLQLILPEVEARHDWFRLIYRADDPRVSLYERLGNAMLEMPLQ